MKNTIIAILAVLVIALGGYVVYDKVNNKNNNKINESNPSNNEEQNKTVNQETLNNLLNILGIDKQSFVQNNLTDIQGVVNEISTEQKNLLTYLYASSNNMLTNITKEQHSYCDSDNCKGILKNDFVKIAKLYGITDDPTNIFRSEQIADKYYIYDGGVGGITKVNQTNIKASYSNNDIILTTDSTLSEAGNVLENKTMTYVFKLNNENNYYLYSVSSK